MTTLTQNFYTSIILSRSLSPSLYGTITLTNSWFLVRCSWLFPVFHPFLEWNDHSDPVEFSPDKLLNKTPSQSFLEWNNRSDKMKNLIVTMLD